MSYRVIVQSDPSSEQPATYSPEMLRHIGMQVEALMSQYSSLKIHKRAIERQLAAIAARISEHDGVLHPRSVFLLRRYRVRSAHRATAGSPETHQAVQADGC
jgi:hypothetical protein